MTETNSTCEKQCPQCLEVHPLDSENFYAKVSRGRTVFSRFCKPCTREKAKINRNRDPELTKRRRKENYIANAESRRAAMRKYRENNLEAVKERVRKYHRENYAVLYAKADERRRANPQKRSKQQAAYIRERANRDPLFAATFRIRNLIKESLRGRGVRKNTKTEKILGCTFASFKAHLESQFLPGMGWENRGDWHIDHIIPISSAKSEDEVIQLNHFTNLRPLWAEDNLRKANKMPGDWTNRPARLTAC